MKRRAKYPPWKTAPTSATCQVDYGLAEKPLVCGKPTAYAYPAMSGGWMALCHEHGQKHLPQIEHITGLILNGESLIARVQTGGGEV